MFVICDYFPELGSKKLEVLHRALQQVGVPTL